MNIIKARIPILSLNKVDYQNVSFDGQNYYFLGEKSDQIDIFDDAYHIIKKQELKKNYDHIAYCNKRNGFCLHANENIRRVVYTNMDFEETRQINLFRTYGKKITSISYSEKEDMVYFTTSDYIFAIEEKTGNIRTLSKDLKNRDIKKINEYMYLYQQGITEFTAAAMIEEDLYLAYCREKESYLAKVKNGEIIEEYYIDDHCYIHNIINCNGVIQLFVTKNNKYIYETKLCTNISIPIEKNENDLSEDAYDNHIGCNMYQEITSVTQEELRNNRNIT